jgi:hypothetical protein
MKKQPASGGARTSVKKAAPSAASLKSQKRPADNPVKKKIEKALKRLHPMD